MPLSMRSMPPLPLLLVLPAAPLVLPEGLAPPPPLVLPPDPQDATATPVKIKETRPKTRARFILQMLRRASGAEKRRSHDPAASARSIAAATFAASGEPSPSLP